MDRGLQPNWPATLRGRPMKPTSHRWTDGRTDVLTDLMTDLVTDLSADRRTDRRLDLTGESGRRRPPPDGRVRSRTAAAGWAAPEKAAAQRSGEKRCPPAVTAVGVGHTGPVDRPLRPCRPSYEASGRHRVQPIHSSDNAKKSRARMFPNYTCYCSHILDCVTTQFSHAARPRSNDAF